MSGDPDGDGLVAPVARPQCPTVQDQGQGGHRHQEKGVEVAPGYEPVEATLPLATGRVAGSRNGRTGGRSTGAR